MRNARRFLPIVLLAVASLLQACDLNPADSANSHIGPSPVGQLSIGQLNAAFELDGSGELADLGLSDDGAIIVTGHLSGQVHLWDGVNGRHLRRIAARDMLIARVAVAPDGSSIAIGGGYEQYTVDILSTADGSVAHTLAAQSTVMSLHYTGDGRHLISFGGDGNGGDHSILVWNAVTGELTDTVEFEDSRPFDARVTGENVVVSVPIPAHEPGTLIFRVTNGRMSAPRAVPDSWFGLGVVAAGEAVVSLEVGLVTLRDVGTGEVYGSIPVEDYFDDLALLHGGTHIVIATDNYPHPIATTTGRPARNGREAGHYSTLSVYSLATFELVQEIIVNERVVRLRASDSPVALLAVSDRPFRRGMVRGFRIGD